MTEYQIEVRVTPRRGILDPQGNAVSGALGALGFHGVREVHVGRLIVFQLDAEDEDEARERSQAMCRQLLANPVTEDFSVRVAAASGSAR